MYLVMLLSAQLLSDRLTGLMMLFVMALLVLPLRPESFPVTLSIAIGVVCILVCSSALFCCKVH